MKSTPPQSMRHLSQPFADGQHARDLPAIELAVAVLLTASAPPLPTIWVAAGVLVLCVLARVVGGTSAAGAWRRVLAAFSGLAWGSFCALLLASGQVPQSIPVLSLALLSMAAVPAFRQPAAMRLYAAGSCLPPATVLLAAADQASLLLGGLLLALLLLALSLPRTSGRIEILSEEQLLPAANDVLSRELRALALRNSWRVIDGADNDASEQQQADHQSAQRHV